jgi:hypothetical protein
MLLTEAGITRAHSYILLLEGQLFPRTAVATAENQASFHALNSEKLILSYFDGEIIKKYLKKC